MSAHEADWRAAWRGALDELELDVLRADGLLQEPAPVADPLPDDGWQPPSELGPLPQDLHDRAAALLDRQLAVAEALVRAMLGNRQHVELVDRFGAHPSAGPAYLDRSA